MRTEDRSSKAAERERGEEEEEKSKKRKKCDTALARENALACFSARAFAGQGGPFCFISPARGPERTAKRQSGEKKRELLPHWLEEERQRRTSPLPQAEQRAKREESERGKIPRRKKAALTGAAAPAPVAVAASARSALLAADTRDMSASVRKRASERARGLRAGERGREKRKNKRIWRCKKKKKLAFFVACFARFLLHSNASHLRPTPPTPLARALSLRFVQFGVLMCFLAFHVCVIEEYRFRCCISLGLLPLSCLSPSLVSSLPPSPPSLPLPPLVSHRLVYFPATCPHTNHAASSVSTTSAPLISG